MRNELRGVSGLSVRRMVEGLALSDDLLGSIRTPTFFLWGENDPFGGPDTAHAVVARIPGAELEMLPGAGHAPWLDDVEHAAKATSRFLSS